MGTRVTMDDVAAAAGVSRALVSIVFREVPGASDETRRRVLAVADRLGYRRDLAAARLASRASKTLGVFLFDMRNDLTAEVFEGIRQESEEQGYSLVVGISDPTGRKDEEILSNLISARVEAIILISCTLPGTMLRTANRTCPLVSATRRVNGIDSVISDDHAGAALIVDHLVDLGHRHITLLAPPWRPSPRVTGYEDAMRAAGLEPDVITVDYDQPRMRQQIEAVVDRQDRPTAIFANNDVTAYAVLDILYEHGLSSPADMAVAGYDDLRISSLQIMGLTSINQHATRIGILSAQAAISRLEQPDIPSILKILAPELVSRRTTIGATP